ncbi:MAG: hypothetical protein PHX33_07835 [Candidatus Cloacimonetes bacterium]|nr:hypothetical protein [Candidatus Cloacimonadota bacterium]
MIKRVIDEKIKQNQELKEYFSALGLSISNESIISLINMAINDLETIKFLYLHELKNKENIKDEKIKQLQEINEYCKNYTLELSDELIMQLIKYEDESQGSKTVKIDEEKLTIGEPKELFKNWRKYQK